MHTIHYDLFSDLHDNFWPSEQHIKWKGLGTSLVAVVAGDISNDWNYTYKQLVEISRHYRHVIFVDGNHEHGFDPNIAENCQKFQDRLSMHNNITYLYKTCIVLDDTAFVGCNGWWTYNFCRPEMTTAQCWDNLIETGANQKLMSEIYLAAKKDAQTLVNQVSNFNKDSRIKHIVVVTHTAPLPLFRYIPKNVDWEHMGRTGNSFMSEVLEANTNKKIRNWCFGHTHHEIDEVVDGIRYVCHPRGRPEENLGQIYFPKLIEV